MRSLLGILLQLGLIGTATAQQASPWPPAWIEPVEATHIVGPIYSVGTRGLANYLITTEVGHILIDGGMPQTAASVEASIRNLGFKPEDIRLLLITHAHVDHAGATAHFKKLSGAAVAVMDRDFEHLKSGGKTDPVYAKAPPFYFPEVTAERVFKDGGTVSLGNIRMTARLGAGHTQGATTWITRITDGGRSYNVVFPCCTGINPAFGPVPGYRLVVNPSYPGIADDYRRTFKMLATLEPDIWLGAHTETFDFDGKRARAAKDGVKAWIDPEGYRQYLVSEKAKFDGLVAKEKQGSVSDNKGTPPSVRAW
jgi:metallo-beta-lactamase class B